MPRNLEQWLAHLEAIHARPIDLGLERVAEVLRRMAVSAAFPVITVGGTNGKGSTCAMLEAVLARAGYRVGLYSSPHLLRYNERVRVAGRDADDATLCAAFERVEAARGEVSLTYFEFGTLAAWQLFAARGVDVAVLEVGLGGRLDAVNLFDPDCAVVVSVDMDHMDYLGPTREHIGYEKAGIFRAGRPAIVGDPDPPARLLEHARTLGADLRLIGRDFGYEATPGQWRYWSRAGGAVRMRGGLAHPGLRGANQLGNASLAMAALESVQQRLPVNMQDIRRGLLEVELPGRFQVLPGRPTVVLDVAHNPHAAAVLADNLGSMGFHPQTWAVLGMLRDKDIAGVVERLRPRVDRWLLASLPGERGASAAELAAVLARMGMGTGYACFDSPARAYAFARGEAGENDRILALGSFLTVADVMRAIADSR